MQSFNYVTVQDSFIDNHWPEQGALPNVYRPISLFLIFKPVPII